ncbi:hypothetical protein L4C36_14545 [Photobacterium japonica]|uniref:hypothetical protein n=1 Tax=Photobacterium japonica TaxID=2910235 RepID=UPI003D0FA26B
MKTSRKRLIALLFLLFPLLVQDGVVPLYTPELPSLSHGKHESTTGNTGDRPSFISMQREAFEASKDLYIDMGIIPEHKDALIFNPTYQDNLLSLPEQHIPTLAATAKVALASYAYDFPPLLFEKMRTLRKNASSVPQMVLANNAPQSSLSSGQSFRPSINKQSSQSAAGDQVTAPSSSSAGNAPSASSDVSSESEQNDETGDNEGSESVSASSEQYTGSPVPDSLNAADSDNEGNVATSNHVESHEQSLLQDNVQDGEASGNAAPPHSFEHIETDDIFQAMTAQDPSSVILVNAPIKPDSLSADEIMQTIIHEPSSLWFFLLLPLGYWVARSKLKTYST